MEGEPILDTKPTGLLPFTPLMKRPTDMDAAEWLHRCVQSADSVDVPNKPAYLGEPCGFREFSLRVGTDFKYHLGGNHAPI